MLTRIALCLLATAAVATAASAAPRHDYAAEVRAMETAAQLTPNDGGTLIELAAAYQRAGRTADANTTFRRVLTRDNAMLETPSGDSVWSYEVAHRALARDVALTAR